MLLVAYHVYSVSFWSTIESRVNSGQNYTICLRCVKLRSASVCFSEVAKNIEYLPILTKTLSSMKRHVVFSCFRMKKTLAASLCSRKQGLGAQTHIKRFCISMNMH